MLISHRHRFIFIHVPKTGGSSVTAALRPFCEPETLETARQGGLKVHSTARDVIRVFGRDVWDSYFTFALERNPWDKCLSLYFSHLQNGYRKFMRPRQPTFQQWFYPFGFWPKKLKSSFELYSLEGKSAVDFLGAYERLNDDFSLICRRIGLPDVTLPVRNKSKLRSNPTYQEHYTPAMRRRIEQVYAREIALFNYSFDPVDQRAA